MVAGRMAGALLSVDVQLHHCYLCIYCGLPFPAQLLATSRASGGHGVHSGKQLV
jgi:hypothetical protein